MPVTPLTAVVAGHICLDIIPAISHRGGFEQAFAPGRLLEVGAAALATGGAVSNTGLALHKLGIPTRLMGKVGDDIFGRAILTILESYHPTLIDRMIVSRGEASSYSVVISPPHVDRIFLHYPGANDTFGAADIQLPDLNDVSLFHFGYPPLMRRLYADGGIELAAILRTVKERHITTSLDMARPDPQADAGRADWPAILRRALPYVDVFLPSFEEILFMLDRDRFEALKRASGADELILLADGALLRNLADRLLSWGAGVVGIKLGDQGLYLRTSASSRRWDDMGAGFPTGAAVEAWRGRELLAPCFFVEMVGTTGAGDSTVAGFLAALLHGMAPEEALTRAVAVGACNVEAADAASGVQSWDAVEKRMQAGWKRRSVTMPLSGWNWDARRAVWAGPGDQGRR
ncbi:MAG: carbohydrate kinase family protein [Bacilli bacterium]